MFVVTFGHVTKMAVTPFDPLLPKTPGWMQTLWLYLQNQSYCGSKVYYKYKVYIQTWSVSLQDVPSDRKWTFYLKAFESCCIVISIIHTDRCTYIRPENLLLCRSLGGKHKREMRQIILYKFECVSHCLVMFYILCVQHAKPCPARELSVHL